MAVEAYVLIQTEVGKAADVALAVSKMDDVVAAEGIMGPYDLIARVRGIDHDAIAKLIVSRVQVIDGVTRTLTCPIVHL